MMKATSIFNSSFPLVGVSRDRVDGRRQHALPAVAVDADFVSIVLPNSDHFERFTGENVDVERAVPPPSRYVRVVFPVGHFLPDKELLQSFERWRQTLRLLDIEVHNGKVTIKINGTRSTKAHPHVITSNVISSKLIPFLSGTCGPAVTYRLF